MNNNNTTVIAALTEEHIVRITGLTKAQLRAWDKRGFFIPKYAYDKRATAYSRIYSFEDAVGLKTLAELKSRYRISIKRLENLAIEMKKDGIHHWAEAKIWVVKGEPHYLRPTSNKEVKGSETGQLAMLYIIDVINDVTAEIEILKKRKADTFGHIDRQKYVARNSWVIAGTRIPTATIRRYFEAGYSKEQILKEYPTLTIEDVDAALEHEKGLAKSA